MSASEGESVRKAGLLHPDKEECQRMRIVEAVGHTRMEFVAVELNERREILRQTNVQSTDRTKFLVVSSVYDARVRSDRQTGPVLEVFACGEVERSSSRGTDPVGANAEDDGWTIHGLRYRDKRQQRMHLADFRIEFQPDMHPRMPAVNECRAHRGPVDLPS